MLNELERFIELGYYEQLKTLVKHTDKLKKLVREEVEEQDIKRYVWEEHGVVGKFRNIKRYKYDHKRLNEHLLNLGILPFAATIKKELLLDAEIDVLNLIRGDKDLTINKVRFFPKRVFQVAAPNTTIKPSLILNQLCISDCVYLWREYKRLIDNSKNQWSSILTTISICDYEEEYHEIQSNYGKVTIQKEHKYSSLDVLKLLGEEVLLRCSQINSEKLEEFAVRGFISKVEINKYRQILNIERQFLLMELSSEEKAETWLFNRREKLRQINVSWLRESNDKNDLNAMRD